MTRPLTDLMEAIAKINQANGWFATARPFSEDIALLHSEVSEAHEEWRDGHLPEERYYSAHGLRLSVAVDPVTGVPNKPEGIPSELADILVRVLDTCYRYGIDPDEVVAEKLTYNATRGLRHGGKVH
jgi:NTP pyrophosphatase (non-canonical NTP hydrolase)